LTRDTALGDDLMVRLAPEHYSTLSRTARVGDLARLLDSLVSERFMSDISLHS
jgi:hypothetical protein